MQFLVKTILNISEKPSRPNTQNSIRLGTGSDSPATSYATQGSTMDVYFPPSTDESYNQDFNPTTKKKCC